MKNIALKYLIINVVLAAIVFFIFYFFQWDESYKNYGFISYLIVAIASALVFLGVYIVFKLGINKGLIVYLYGALIKNGILVLFCYKYRQIAGNIIFYLFFIYMILMILEIIFILKLNKYEELKK